MINWTNLELERLLDPDNHKIVSDGYDWRWYNKMSGKWTIHSIKVFEDENTPYAWLQYNSAQWLKELTARRFKKARKERSIARKIRLICQEQERSTYFKVLEIHRLNPKLSHNEIALLIGVSRQLVDRYVKDAA
ncbi:hypothetical protein OO009_03005 [Flavobacteriaceae bacterium KMM 6897]|nr:hypothetical protein [Flavobacteriaceae bacterium KMM 6897]